MCDTKLGKDSNELDEAGSHLSPVRVATPHPHRRSAGDLGTWTDPVRSEDPYTAVRR
jgi:hypothetical protein